MSQIIAILKGKTVNISLKQIVINKIYVVNYTVIVVLHHVY